MILCWAIEFDNLGGEGILARTYIKKLSKSVHEKIIVITPSKIFLVKESRIKSSIRKNRSHASMQQSKNLFKQRFIYPLEGIFILFLNRGFKKKIYLNYLPLWQFPIFLMSKIFQFQLGPIVGGVFNKSRYKNLSSNFVRVYLMRFFYFLSVLIIKIFKIKVIAANSSIDQYLKGFNIFPEVSSINLLPSKENVLRGEVLKDIDIVLYFRNHDSKYPIETKKIAKYFSDIGYKVIIFGEKYASGNIKHLGYIDKNSLIDLFSRSKIFINLADNPENLTVFDAISQDCFVVNVVGMELKNELIHTCKKFSDIKVLVGNLLRKKNPNYQNFSLSIQKKQKQVELDLEDFFKEAYTSKN
tara:strand:- start:24 stop:1091 length:1068 start_codon:yes stop_codon:yes gene_type:complete